MPEPGRVVLLFEDNPGDATLVRYSLRAASEPFCVEVVPTLREGLDRLNRSDVDVILVDLDLPDSHGLDTFLRVHARAPWIPVVVLSGLEDDEVALLAVQHGAQDYLYKGTMSRAEVLVRTLRYAMERSRIEAEIVRRDLRLTQAQEVAGLGWWEWDLGTNRVECSDGFNLIVGTRNPDRCLSSETFLQCFGSEQGRVACLLRDVARRNAPVHEGFAIRRPDGTERQVELRGGILSRGIHGAQRLVGTLQDVTERFRIEKQLRDRELFQSIFETGVVACAITRRHDDRFVEVNQSLTELTGYGREEICGRTPAELGLWVDPAERGRFIEALENDGSVRNFEARIRHRQGEERSVDLSALAIQYAGEPHLVHFLRDVSGERSLREQLVQAQKMEAIGRLAGGVAHDFNNLLTVIGTSLFFGRRDLPADHPAQTSLASIEQAAESAARLTRQLLAFARKQIVAPKLLDPNGLVEGLAPLLRPLLGEDIEIRISAGQPVGLVRIDPGEFEQVLLNLAVNARDAMPNGGAFSIDVLADRVSREEARQHGLGTFGSYVRIDVRDSGLGMSEEVRRRAFEPFFTTKETGKGTGLGLATCYGIVTQAGGRIAIDSTIGRGTVVSLFLPRVEGDSDSVRSSTSHDADLPRGQESILVVEDEPAVRATMSQTLQELGYRVLAAENGWEAARRVGTPGSAGIDLLVTDVVMPLVGGAQVADRLTAVLPDLRVLYVSGYVDHAMVRSRAEEGAAFLQKPFSPGALARKVREVLDG